MDATDIENLIAQVALGDRAAFGALYDSTSAKLMGVVLRVLKNQAAAEDAVQECYIKIWHKADSYRANGLSPMTWLITIARNTAIDRLRAQRPTSDMADHEETLASTGPSPEASSIATSEARRIASCMGELDESKRDAVRGAYLDGQSYADLAARFDVPLNTMRSWLRRSLLSLKECLSR